MAGRHNDDKLMLESIVYDDEKMRILLREVSKKIVQERKKRGLSVNRLADISNLTSSYIFKMENCHCELGLRSLLKISTALGLKPDDLLPVESNDRRLTNGDQFDQITQEADVKTINFLLAQAKELIELQKEQK